MRFRGGRLLGVRRLVAALVRSQRCLTWDQSGDKSPHSKETPLLMIYGVSTITLFARNVVDVARCKSASALL